MKRILVALSALLALLTSAFAPPTPANAVASARQASPAIDVGGALPASSRPLAYPVIDNHGRRPVIVDRTRRIPIPVRRMAARSELDVVARLTSGYLISGRDDTRSSPAYYLLDARGTRVSPLLPVNGPTPVVSRSGAFIAWTAGSTLKVYSVARHRVVRARRFPGAHPVALGLTGKKVAVHSARRLRVWSFRSGKVVRRPAKGAWAVSANLKRAIVTVGDPDAGLPCQAVLDIASGRTYARTCSTRLAALSPDGAWVAEENDGRTQGESDHDRVVLRAVTGATGATATYDAGRGNVLLVERCESDAALILDFATPLPDGAEQDRTLRCTPTRCEEVRDPRT